MIPRRAAFPTLVLALLGAGLVVPALGSFLTTLGFCLALAGIVLWLFRAGYRRAPQRRTTLEVAAIGGAGAFGLLFLFQNVLVHDALWYYGYLRSSIVQGSLDLYEEFVLMNPHGMYLPPPETPLIHLGTALFQAPVALIVRPLALWLDRIGFLPGGDGFGPLETAAATWTSAMLGIGGVALVHRLARRVAGGPASAVAQVALLYASPLAFFTFIWPAYPHAASVFIGAAFLLTWAGAAQTDNRNRSFLLGLLGGLLALVRPQDIVYLTLPCLDLLIAAVPVARRNGMKSLGPHLRKAGQLALGVMTGFMPQVVAWWITAGTPVAHVYSDIGDPFRWSNPAFGSVLFSIYNGLVTWTPLCGAGILGIFLLRRSNPRLFRGLLLLLVLEWWAIASYGYWWGGASFGARYFLSAYPVFGVGLAVLLHRFSQKFGTLTTGLCAVPFVFWNLLLMAQFRLEWIPHNVRPDFGEALRRQLFEIPEVWISGLTGSFKWNQVMLVELFTVAWESRDWLRLAGSVVLTVALVAVLLVWVHRLGFAGENLEAGKPVGSSRKAEIAGVACMIAATIGVALVSQAPGFGQRRIVSELQPTPIRMASNSVTSAPLDRDRGGPTPRQPTAVRSVPADDEPANRLSLDVISFLHNAEDHADGELIASIRVQGRGCGNQPLRLRAGYETAETAPERIETVGRMSHSTEGMNVIQSWWQPYNSASYYWGHAYLASFELPATCEPVAVQIRTEEGVSDIEIRRLIIATSPGLEPIGLISEM